MSAKPRLLLLDTVVVLEAMRQAKWLPLCRLYDVILPSIVVNIELQYFVDAAEVHHELVCEPVAGSDRHRFVTTSRGVRTAPGSCPVWAGEFRQWAAAPHDLIQTGELLHPELRLTVHDGEREAVTYLRMNDAEEPTYYATADAGAIKAVVAFNGTTTLLSFEDVLNKCGHSVAKLDHHFCSPFVKRAIEQGQVLKIQGRALAPVPKAGKRKVGKSKP